MQVDLNELFKISIMGSCILAFNRLFSRILIAPFMFARNKSRLSAITDQIQNLIILMRQLVQEGGRHVEF